MRAQIIVDNDLIAASSMVEAKKRGTVRMEGKPYSVQDGDSANVLCNV